MRAQEVATVQALPQLEEWLLKELVPNIVATSRLICPYCTSYTHICQPLKVHKYKIAYALFLCKPYNSFSIIQHFLTFGQDF